MPQKIPVDVNEKFILNPPPSPLCFVSNFFFPPLLFKFKYKKVLFNKNKKEVNKYKSGGKDPRE